MAGPLELGANDVRSPIGTPQPVRAPRHHLVVNDDDFDFGRSKSGPLRVMRHYAASRPTSGRSVRSELPVDKPPHPEDSPTQGRRSQPFVVARHRVQGRLRRERSARSWSAPWLIAPPRASRGLGGATNLDAVDRRPEGQQPRPRASHPWRRRRRADHHGGPPGSHSRECRRLPIRTLRRLAFRTASTSSPADSDQDSNRSAAVSQSRAAPLHRRTRHADVADSAGMQGRVENVLQLACPCRLRLEAVLGEHPRGQPGCSQRGPNNPTLQDHPIVGCRHAGIFAQPEPGASRNARRRPGPLRVRAGTSPRDGPRPGVGLASASGQEAPSAGETASWAVVSAPCANTL